MCVCLLTGISNSYCNPWRCGNDVMCKDEEREESILLLSLFGCDVRHFPEALGRGMLQI